MSSFGISSSLPASFIVEGYPSATVCIHIYDLVEWNECLYAIGLGAHHVGIQVYNIEYAYGASPEGTGIVQCIPGFCPPHIWREQLTLGITSRTREEVEAAVLRFIVDPDWHGTAYRLLSHNCIHFVETFLRFLQPQAIPTTVSLLLSSHTSPRTPPKMEDRNGSGGGGDGGEAEDMTSGAATPSSRSLSPISPSAAVSPNFSPRDAKKMAVGKEREEEDAPFLFVATGLPSRDERDTNEREGRLLEFYYEEKGKSRSPRAANSTTTHTSSGNEEEARQTSTRGKEAMMEERTSTPPTMVASHLHSSCSTFSWVPPYVYRLQEWGLRLLPRWFLGMLEEQQVESEATITSAMTNRRESAL